MSSFVQTALNGLGVTGTKQMELAPASQIWLLRPGTTFATSEALATLATVNGKIAAKTMMVIPNIIDEEDITSEDGVYTTPYGQRIFIQPGIRGTMFKAELTADQLATIQSYSDQDWEMIVPMRNGRLACVIDGVLMKGFELATFYVGSVPQPKNKEVALVPIVVQHADASEFNDNLFVFKPQYNLSKIDPLRLITIAQTGSVASNAATIQAYYASGHSAANDGTANAIPLSGIVVDNVQMLHSGDAVTSPTFVETSALGTYTAGATALVSGDTVQVIATADDLTESNIVTLV